MFHVDWWHAYDTLNMISGVPNNAFVCYNSQNLVKLNMLRGIESEPDG